jgi:hypothetical protein
MAITTLNFCITHSQSGQELSSYNTVRNPVCASNPKVFSPFRMHLRDQELSSYHASHPIKNDCKNFRDNALCDVPGMVVD